MPYQIFVIRVSSRIQAGTPPVAWWFHSLLIRPHEFIWKPPEETFLLTLSILDITENVQLAFT